MAENNYTVYKHVFPNGKVYIGMTGQKPEDRWNNGMAYAGNGKMFFDIVRFGWNNIEHQIIKDGLTKQEAEELEQSMIEAFGDDGRTKTYNRVYAKYRCEGKNHQDDLYKDSTQSARAKHIGDDWVDPYTPSGMYLGLNFMADAVNLYVAVDGWSVKHFAFHVPETRKTLNDVSTWLYSAPHPDETTIMDAMDYWSRAANSSL